LVGTSEGLNLKNNKKKDKTCRIVYQI